MKNILHNKNTPIDHEYYTVGSTVYRSKIDACIAGTQQNIHPVWYFNDHVWQKQNWQQEPETDVLELYKMRARQIREQYDYVIVFYSGGSDSQTMVEAFFKAGCFIDEIHTIWNRKINKNFISNTKIIDPRNIEAEFELTTRKGLDWIRDASPKTKITYHDISDSTIENFKIFDGEEWLCATNEHLSPQAITRWSVTRQSQLAQLDQGRRTAAVYGVDKPRVCIKDNRYCVYFLDSIVNCFRGQFNDLDYTNLNSVLFYWAPEFPEIVIKQAHMIRRWFELNTALKPILEWPKGQDYTKRQVYEIITRSIVYPEWDLQTFQCAKNASTVFMEWDDWFHTGLKDTIERKSWYRGIEHVQQNVDQKYLNFDFDKRLTGFAGMINGHFALD